MCSHDKVSGDQRGNWTCEQCGTRFLPSYIVDDMLDEAMAKGAQVAGLYARTLAGGEPEEGLEEDVPVAEAPKPYPYLGVPQ